MQIGTLRLMRSSFMDADSPIFVARDAGQGESWYEVRVSRSHCLPACPLLCQLESGVSWGSGLFRSIAPSPNGSIGADDLPFRSELKVDRGKQQAILVTPLDLAHPACPLRPLESTHSSTHGERPTPTQMQGHVQNYRYHDRSVVHGLGMTNACKK